MWSHVWKIIPLWVKICAVIAAVGVFAAFGYKIVAAALAALGLGGYYASKEQQENEIYDAAARTDEAVDNLSTAGDELSTAQDVEGEEEARDGRLEDAASSPPVDDVPHRAPEINGLDKYRGRR